MKLKKILTLMCCAVLLVCISVGATVAYLTAQDSVVNTFTVGNVKINLTEAAIKAEVKDGVVTGNWIEDSTQARVKQNGYKLLPGMTYAKDPTVVVEKGSDDCYVRALVTVDKKAELDAIFAPNGADLTSIFGGVSADWTLAKETENETSRTYEFRYNDIVSALSAEVTLDDIFETITVPGSITKEQLATINNMTITVVAHAIQSTGFANADAAWAEWK